MTKTNPSRQRRQVGCRPTACAFLLALAPFFTACQSVTPSGGTGRSATVTAPCAARLHEICGAVLLYYAQHQSLPPALEALRGAGSTEPPPLECPESGEPFVYHRKPLDMPGRPGRLLMHAPTASQATVGGQPGIWAVLATERGERTQGIETPGGSSPPQGGRKQLSTQVVLIPEREIAAALGR